MDSLDSGPENRPLRRKDLYYYYDLIFYIYDESKKALLQFWDDLVFNLAIGVAPTVGYLSYALIGLFAFTIRDKEKSPLWRPVKFVIGITLLVPMVFLLLSVVLLGGAFTTIIGMRNLAEYSFLEEVIAWFPIVAFFVCAPMFLNFFWLDKIQLVFCLSVIIIGFDFLFGQCGILSLGHAAFAFAGSFFTAYLYTGTFGFQLPFIPSLILAGFMGATLGVLLGLPSLRVKDHYLTVISLGFAIALPNLFRSRYFKGINGLSTGGLSIEQPVYLNFLKDVNPRLLDYYFLLTCAFVLTVVAHNLIRRSQIGRALRILKCDNEVSKILGISPLRYKIFAFSLSAFYAAVGGGMMLLYTKIASIEGYPLTESIDYYVALVIGGPSSIFGSFIGGSFLAFDTDFTSLFGRILPQGERLARVFYGVLLIVVMFFMPDGTSGAISNFFKKRLIKKPRRGRHYSVPPPEYDVSDNRNSPIKSE